MASRLNPYLNFNGNARQETPAGYSIMAADVTSDMEYHAPAGFSVSLSGDDGDALRGYYQKLAAGGAEIMPLQKQAAPVTLLMYSHARDCPGPTTGYLSRDR